MLDFIIGDENKLINDPRNAPVTTAFVVVESENGYMLLYNKYRRLWEITGGMIETGESARDCAVRECKEESNQTLIDLRFIGLGKFFMKSDGSVMNSALYYAFLRAEAPFYENDEIRELRWWKPGEELINIDRESLAIIYAFLKGAPLC